MIHPDHIARLLAHRRQNGLLAKRVRRLPRQQHPVPIQRDYAAALIRLTIDPIRHGLAQLRRDLPAMLARNPHAKQTSSIPPGSAAPSVPVSGPTGFRSGGLSLSGVRRDDDSPEQVRQTIKHLRASINIPDQRAAEVSRTYGKRASDFQKVQLGRQLEAGYGMAVPIVDRHIQSRMNGFVGANVSLITNLPHEVVSDVEQTIMRAFAAGDRWEDLADDLDERLDIGENRATLIARDQIGKLTGQVNVDRQRELGVKKFIWRTVNDNRVRDEHTEYQEESEKEPYDFDDPPDDGLPGEAVNCRCFAEPVLVFDDGSVEEDDSDDEGDDDDADREDASSIRLTLRRALHR